MPEQIEDPSSVQRAVAEYDAVGQEAFLERYGFRRSARYLLRVDGKTYESKAIVGVAYGYEHPESGPLKPSEFSGGVGHGGAAFQLRRLGFDIMADEDSPQTLPADLAADASPRSASKSVPAHATSGDQAPVALGRGETDRSAVPPLPSGKDISGSVRDLLEGRRLRSADLTADRSIGNAPGLYAWFGDSHARTAVKEALALDVGELLYVGQAGATKWPSGTRSGATLGSRIRSQHLGGNARSSTLRRTFAAVLLEQLDLRVAPTGGLDRPSEQRLSRFMTEHLAVALNEHADGDALSEVEAAVVRQLDPPLNLDHVELVDHRRRLRELRSALRHR